MNKAILGILAASLIAAGKSVSSKKQKGSFGKKKNKELDAFNSWVNRYISDACDRVIGELRIDKYDVENPILSLHEAINLFKDENYKQSEFIESGAYFDNPENCPEVYAYASLGLGFCTYSNFPESTSGFIENAFTDSIEFMFDKDRRYIPDRSGIREFYKRGLADIERIRKIAGYSDEIESENIMKKNLFFFESVENPYQPSLFGQMQEQKNLTVEIPPSIFSAGIIGFIIVGYLKCIVSMVFDKNLAEATKLYYLKLAEQGKIYTGRHPSYNIDLLVIDQQSLPTQKIFTSSSSRAVHRFIGTDYSGQIMGRIKRKLINILDEKTMMNLSDTFNNFEDISIRYRDRIRAIISPRADEVNMSVYCDGFLGNLLELSKKGYINTYGSEHNWGILATDYYFDVDEDFYEVMFEDAVNSSIGVTIHSLLLDGIGSFEAYIEAVNQMEGLFSEARTGEIDEAMSFWIEESIESIKSESRQLSESFGIGDSSITVNTQDQILAQLPISKIQSMPLSNEENISRVILVEYKNPKTLISITQNTLGNLCVGKQGMPYRKKLSSGEQRHFGVLAQKRDGGLYVMYHTHASGNSIADFTDAKNRQNVISSFPAHHRDILVASKQKIEEILK